MNESITLTTKHFSPAASLAALGVKQSKIASIHSLIDAQVADSPGRHEPGTEEIHRLNALAALGTPGYQVYVGLECNPTTSSEASLAWLPEDRSGMLAVSDLRL